MAITKAKLNKVALTRLKMYLKTGKTVVVFCPRYQIQEYLNQNECKFFEVCGSRFRPKENWQIVVLN